MDLKNINIDDHTNLKCNLLIDPEYKVLLGDFFGDYGIGSKGNLDGLYIFSKIASVYFLYDTISIIVLDFRNLNYTFGNTLIKSLNFFNEVGRDIHEKSKKIVIIVSSENKYEIQKILDFATNINCVIFDNDYSGAVKYSLEEAAKYLTE